MKNFIISLIILTLFSIITTAQIKDEYYLNQEKPGIIPKIFAPGIVSTIADEGCSTFSQDGNIFLFARANAEINGILMMEKKEGVWLEPKLAPFSAGKYDWDFALSPDGRRIFISSGRPIIKNGNPLENYRIWTSEFDGKNWSEAYPLPFPINSGQHDSYPWITLDSTLYFFSNREGGLGQGDIYKAKNIFGEHPIIENLGRPINTPYHEVDAFVDPNGKYLISCSNKPGGFGSFDIYISFKMEDGSWSNPKNMGDKINTKHSEYIPSVSQDDKYFFFTSNKSGNREIYWVETKIFDELRNN